MSDLSITSATVQSVTQWVVHRLGYPVVSVELDDKQLEYAFNESVEQLSYYLVEWSMRNNIANALGLPSNQDFSRIFVVQDFEFSRALAQAYSVQAGVGGDIPVNKDFFILTGGTQEYTIPSGRTVTDVMWVEPAAIDRYLVDPYANANWAQTEFGFAYMGNSLTYITPVYWSLYHAQDFELRNRVRRGDYSYKLLPSSTFPDDGTQIATLYPVPGDKDNGKGVWYFYWDNDDLNKYADGTPGELVSSPGDIRIDEIPYSAMNSWAQFWIKNYTLAVAKEILGRIRGKFNSLPIPDADVQMDAQDLLQEGKEEQQSLIQDLSDELDKLDYSSFLEDAAGDAENLNRQLSFNPGGIFLG